MSSILQKRVSVTVTGKSGPESLKVVDPDNACRVHAQDHGVSRREFFAQAAGIMLGGGCLPTVHDDLISSLNDPDGYLVPETGEINGPMGETSRKPSTGIPSESSHGLFLTFDDGPLPCTEQILDALAVSGHKATFFVMGKNLHNPKLRKLAVRALREGHEIGNHSYSHPNFSQISADRAVSEIWTTHKLIQQIVQEAGVANQRQDLYFRFPFGDSGNVWNSQAIHDTLWKLNYGTAWWDLDTNDWRMEMRWFPRSPSTVVASLNDARPEDVVLLHDRPATARYLPEMLNTLGRLRLVSMALSVIGFGPRVYVADGRDGHITTSFDSPSSEASDSGIEDLLEKLLSPGMRSANSLHTTSNNQMTIGSDLW